MAYTVSELADLAGVSVRALHHYDRMGLLVPRKRSRSGYRLYGDGELRRLQQILLFRELDFPLREIRRILERPGYDPAAALEAHRGILREKGERIARLLDRADPGDLPRLGGPHRELLRARPGHPGGPGAPVRGTRRLPGPLRGPGPGAGGLSQGSPGDLRSLPTEGLSPPGGLSAPGREPAASFPGETSVPFPQERSTMETTLYDFKARSADGKDFDFGALRGRPALIVNTASKCGFTPQYAGLETLHQKFKDQGLAVLAAPCDQFAHQEPGDDEEVVGFCRRNFGVTFPILSKLEVNGPGAHPLFVWLRRKTRGLLGDRIRWNFTKFLVSRDGTTVRRYSPATAPEALERDILSALEN